MIHISSQFSHLSKAVVLNRGAAEHKGAMKCRQIMDFWHLMVFLMKLISVCREPKKVEKHWCKVRHENEETLYMINVRCFYTTCVLIFLKI